MLKRSSLFIAVFLSVLFVIPTFPAEGAALRQTSSKAVSRSSARSVASARSAKSTAKKASTGKQASSAMAKTTAKGFPYSQAVTSDWKTSWPIVPVEGTPESLPNAEYVQEKGATIADYLHIKIPENSGNRDSWKFQKKTIAGTYAWVKPNIAPQTTMFFRFYVRFPKDFDASMPGTLAAIMTGVQNDVREESMGAAWISWDKGALKAGLNGVIADPTMDVIHNEKTSPVPKDGLWHRIDLHARMQTETSRNFNGLVEAWLDGKKFSRIVNAKFDNRTKDLWDGFAIWTSFNNLSSYTKAAKDTWIDLAGFELNDKPFADLKDVDKKIK